jgi:uncharacterized tellurite resistance protein B-like protein
MHILLALLGAIVTILVLLSRLADAGISLGGLNPFLWRRRRAWRQKYEANPLFALEDPMAIAALLAVATAKADGDMSATERKALLAEFESTFSLPARKSAELLTASAHILGDGQLLREKLDDLLAKHSEAFNEAQRESLVGLLERVAKLNGEPSAAQRELIGRVRQSLQLDTAAKGIWA